MLNELVLRKWVYVRLQENLVVIHSRSLKLDRERTKSSFGSTGAETSQSLAGDLSSVDWATAQSTAGLLDQQRQLKGLLKDCAKGFYQEMYFLGKDVLHKDGNQLIHFGFEKSPSKGLKGTSCYTLERTGEIIELYGSCAACYSESSNVVFLRIRSRFFTWIAKESCVAGLWTEKDLERSAPGILFRRLAPLLQWWLEYERWITDRLGKSYRESCYEEWRKVNKAKAWLPPEEALHWVELFLERGSSHTRPRIQRSGSKKQASTSYGPPRI